MSQMSTKSCKTLGWVLLGVVTLGFLIMAGLLVVSNSRLSGERHKVEQLEEELALLKSIVIEMEEAQRQTVDSSIPAETTANSTVSDDISADNSTEPVTPVES